MYNYPEPIEKLVERLMYFSGVGKKTALKMALELVDMSKEKAQDISNAILELKESIKLCNNCYHLARDDLCEVCKDSKRDHSQICVVDSPRDVFAIERTNSYRGVYHVLHGVISPLDGVGVNDLTIAELLKRVEQQNVKEIILANSPTLEGESTAIYLSRVLKNKVENITRIAHGIPIGGELEFADEITLLKALESRRTL